MLISTVGLLPHGELGSRPTAAWSRSTRARGGRDADPLRGASSVAYDGARVWAVADGGVYSIRGRTVTKRLSLGSKVFGLLVA